MHEELIDQLLYSKEPSIRWKVRSKILQEQFSDHEENLIQNKIRASTRVQNLLKNMKSDGSFSNFKHVYDKWQGSHWVLMTLIDLGVKNDDGLFDKAIEQLTDFWLAPRYFKEFEAIKKEDAYKYDAIPIMNGRHRVCASQQGNALWCALHFGMNNSSTDSLAERLCHWQWEDGGWNCDKDPLAHKSTFIHTFYSMRALSLHADLTGNKDSASACYKAKEFLLERQLFLSKRNNIVIKKDFTELHYPLYWHYDILGALKCFAEINSISDKRCSQAIELLKNKELHNGGWCAESKYYSVNERQKLNADFVEWGPTGKSKMNEWITTDALFVLKSCNAL